VVAQIRTNAQIQQRVGARIQFPGGAQVREGARGEIERALIQISDAVTAIPSKSAFWDSMKTSLLHIDAGGCRVVYRFEQPSEIRVIELQEIPE
jgi:hypothetical protein